MKINQKRILISFFALPLIIGLRASADFSHVGIAPNLTPCFPYTYDTGPQIVQIVGIVNRACLYRVIKTAETVECKFNHAQLTHMLNEIKSRPKYKFNTLDALNTFQKYQVTPGVCEIKESEDNLFKQNNVQTPQFGNETYMPMQMPAPSPDVQMATPAPAQPEAYPPFDMPN